MKVAALIGWQTLLADLSLILFIVTAAQISASPTRGTAAPAAAPSATPDPAEPLALWRAGGSQSLRHWLAAEQIDARQHLTITAHYRAGGAVRTLAGAQALVNEAGTMGLTASVIVAPAAREETLATLAYDRPPDDAAAPAPRLAQGLHKGLGHRPVRNQP